jgi:formylglycine-generating enzyme required for sulfatase activity
MTDIFISYAREDQTSARKLADALERKGWTVWWDLKLRAGEHFDDAIEQALTEARCVIVVWSRRSVQSRYVKDEAVFALQHNKLVPVAIDEVSLPFRFQTIHTPRFIGWKGSTTSQAFRQLIEAVHGHIGLSPTEKKAQRKPQLETRVEAGRVKPGETFQDTLLDGSKGPEMVVIPAGTFQMGDIQGKGVSWERPVHEVILDAFAIGRNPVTVGEFRRFVEATGYQTEAEQQDGTSVYDGKEWGQKSDANWRNPYMSQDEDHPVVCISWNDAAAYCEWLCEQTGEQYSLPTEAEWEYACRAGSDTAYCFGDDEKQLSSYAWYSKNAEGKTHPVGEKRPNDWHLYDIHGHVWEWVQDWFGDYSKEPQHNPSGPETGSSRVIHGGSWGRDAGYCRSAFRDLVGPGRRCGPLGFRLARRV